MQKISGKVLIVVFVGVLVVAGLGYGGYRLWTRNQSANQPKPPQVPITPDITEQQPISTWKTYTNETYGYSIKYPDQFLEVKETTGSAKPVSSIQGISLIIKNSKVDSFNPRIGIGVDENTKMQKLEDWFDPAIDKAERWKDKWYGDKIKVIEYTYLGDIPIVRYISYSEEPYYLDNGLVLQHYGQAIAFLHRNRLIGIGTATSIKNQTNSLQKTYEEMLKTLTLF